MNNKNINHEQISAFADGEITDAEIDVALASLDDTEGAAAWDVYHRIGDALRSEEMAISMSAGFSERLSKRLEQEPAIVAPQVCSTSSRRKKMKWFLFPGAAAAAGAATLALVGTPQLMVASKTPAVDAGTSAIVAISAPRITTISAHSEVIENQQKMLRDPGLDEYLLAHQHFSPSVYSTAQYARSAAFAADPDN